MAIIPLQIARVSTLLQSSLVTSSITKTQQSLLEVENELSTGKKINQPSDNPGDAAVVQQIQKMLEQRQAYADNLTATNTQLGTVDSTLGSITNLVQQAQNIASQNVGSDVSADERSSAAAVVDSITSQLLTLSNTQNNGAYIFGGDLSTKQPFVQTNGGVQFVGSTTLLHNTVDENTQMSFQVNGAAVFGALSSRVQGNADLTPSITTSTRLTDLRGATNSGISLGSIKISDGTNTAVVDLTHADSISDVVAAINNAAVGGITAAVNPSGSGIQLSGGASDNISVSEIAGGTTASDLGILDPTGAGAGNAVVGSSLQAKVTLLTPLADLRGGAGIDQTNGLTITNGLITKTVDLSSAVTVEDMLNDINSSGTSVKAEINSAGTGINIINPTQGTNMTIAENGGTTAADLGVRSFDANTPLSQLNGGQGVRTAAGADFQVTDSVGTSFQVDVDGLHTVQDVVDAINTAATSAGAGVTASFATTGNGIVLTDTAGGAGTVSLTAENFSSAAADLGLTTPASGNVITGTDVNPVQPEGIFSHVTALAAALRSNDQSAITAAATALQNDYNNVVQIRGANGAQLQEVQSRQTALQDQNVSTQAVLSNLQDVDYTQAVTQFTTLQTALQATLQSSAQVLNLSLLNFLG